MPSTIAKHTKATVQKLHKAARLDFLPTPATVARIDGKCRVALGSVAQPGEQFTVFREPSGNIVLQPVKIVPANEAWLWENSAALSTVMQGMREAEAGSTQDLGDFTRYAKE